MVILIKYEAFLYEVQEFDEVKICCRRKIRQIRQGLAELCHTQTSFYFANLHGFT